MKKLIASASLLVLPLTALAGGYGMSDSNYSTSSGSVQRTASGKIKAPLIFRTENGDYIYGGSRDQYASRRVGGTTTSVENSTINKRINDFGFRNSVTFDRLDYANDQGVVRAKQDAARAKLLRLRSTGN